MKKYNKFLGDIIELVEKGLYTSQDLKKEVENLARFKAESIASKLNLVSRDEFEVQKKLIEKLQKEILKFKKNKIYTNKKKLRR